jgi:uncharacterized protein (TIGR00369 family)
MKTFDEQFYKERVNTFPFIRLMGMRLLSAGEGKSVMRCRIRPVLRNTAGTLHGGVMGTLVDMSVATALRSVMPLSSGMTTVEYKVNFLKPVPDGVVTAHGTILRLGKTIAAGSVEIRNEEGEVVAFGSATYYIVPNPKKRSVPAIMGRLPGGGRKRR